MPTKITDDAARMQAQEICKDYSVRLSRGDIAPLIHHEEDQDGCTLVVHIPSSAVDDSELNGKLAERLARICGEVSASAKKAPARSRNRSRQQTVEKDKAVIDSPANDEATEQEKQNE